VGAGDFAGLYVVATVLFVPGSVLTLGAGAVSAWAWIGLCSISATLGATAAFLVGRYLARDAIARKSRRTRSLLPLTEPWPTRGGRSCSSRVLAVFPFTLLNYAFGLTRVS